MCFHRGDRWRGPLSYIQWLFPTFEASATNPSARALTYVHCILFLGAVVVRSSPPRQDEAELLRQNLGCAFRFLLSYKYDEVRSWKMRRNGGDELALRGRD